MLDPFSYHSYHERMKKSKLSLIEKALFKLYPDARSELVFEGAYQLVVSVLLSAQCTDKKVNEVTPLLFKRYPSFHALARAHAPELEDIIRPINYYRTKAKHLGALAQRVVADFRGTLPTTHAELLTLPGVGQKTANVVVGELGSESSFPVDTHVFRLARRLGLSTGSHPRDVEEDLKTLFPASSWRGLHHQMIFHGRRVCKALRPLCGECALNALCRFASQVPTKSHYTSKCRPLRRNSVKKRTVKK